MNSTSNIAASTNSDIPISIKKGFRKSMVLTINMIEKTINNMLRIILTPLINGFLNKLRPEVTMRTIARIILAIPHIRHTCFMVNLMMINNMPRITANAEPTAF